MTRKIVVALLFGAPLVVGLIASMLFHGSMAGWALGIDLGRWLTRDSGGAK